MVGPAAAALIAATTLIPMPPAPAPPQLGGAFVLAGDSLAPPARRSAAMAIRAQPEAPRLDGRGDDAVWALAPSFGDFVQRDPSEGQPATERTDVRATFTDDALYVLVRAYDSRPDLVRGLLTRRDAESPSDWIVVAVDSYHDRRTAFQFWVNPAGVKRDIYIFNDGEQDDSWDAVWDVSVSRDQGGWTAEYRIPFSQLRFTAGVDRFGFNVGRVVNRLNETSMWRLVPRNQPGDVSHYGDLEGLAGIRPPRRLEVLPYSVARTARTLVEEDNPFRDGRDASATAGADVKLGIGSNLTLDATINPDFGQVEADPAVVNLSAFETFFPERRPFFLEGVNIFRFPIALGDGDGANEQLFYSRRIGRAPQGWAEPPDGGYSETLQSSSILAAAKLSGKTTSGWTIGLLGALTAEEQGRVADSTGTIVGHEPIAPRTSHVIGRLARDLRNGRTVLGVFGTYLHRELPANLSWLRRDAASFGVDWNHRFASDRYRFRGWAVGSNVRGSAEAIDLTQQSSARYFQRPDMDYVSYDPTRTALSGFAAQAVIGKENGNWRWSTGVDTRSPGFEVNDIGYMRDADRTIQFAWLSHRWLRPGKVFRRVQINVNQHSSWNYGWDRRSLGGNVNGNFRLTNYWGGYLGVNRQLGGLTNELRGGPLIRTPPNVNGWAGFYSDDRKTLQGYGSGWFFVQDESGAQGGGISGGLTWRPSGRLDLSAEPSVDWNNDTWQYLEAAPVLGATEYFFGGLRQTTVALGVRANATFTPTLSLQVFAQPYYSAGAYTDVKHVTDPRGATFDERFETLTTSRDASGDFQLDLDHDGQSDWSIANPDFSLLSFRSNVVLRWEYRRGSTLFLVWQQTRDHAGSSGQFQPGDAMRTMARTMPENVFVVKVNYWLSL
jgi:hypothetical protein